jgi:sulfoxide reductase heme-binding subunit YedZ
MADLTLLAGLSQHLVLLAATAAANPTMWYFTRTLAIAAYVTLTVSVVLGMLRSIARQSGERLTWIVDELHQFLALLSGLLVAGHLITLMLDPFVPFTLINVLLPLNEPYRPFAVVLGVFALYAMAALLFSSWLRRHLPYRLWRLVHYVSFAAFALITAHGLLAGSDAKEVWTSALYGGGGASVGFLLLMRLAGSGSGQAKKA